MINFKNKLMKHPPLFSKGFTLVELMITLVLSLMITYSIAQVLISSNRSSVSTDGMSQSQETGRFTMSYLANSIREAGLNSITDPDKVTQAFISCEDFPGLTSTTGELACTNNSDDGDTELTINTPRTHGDRLAIASIPSVPRDAANNLAPDLILDCSGVGGYNADDIVLNVFWVEPDGNGMNSLMCQGSKFDGTAITQSNPVQAIANGVESMHLLFGEGIVPLDDDGRNVGHYVSAAAPLAGGVSNWDRVYAVKVSILTRSITAVTNSNTLRSFVLLDSNPYLMTDEVSRQVFTTTFVINNFW